MSSPNEPRTRRARRCTCCAIRRITRITCRRHAIWPRSPTRLAEFLDHVEVAISLHGYGRLAAAPSCSPAAATAHSPHHLADHIDVPGYHVVTDLDAIPRELRGLHPDNPVNRVRGGGAQLELSPRLRGTSPRSAPPNEDGLSAPTSALIQGLVAAARSWDPAKASTDHA